MGYEYLMQAYPETSSTLSFERACDAVMYGTIVDKSFDGDEAISRIWSKPIGIETMHEIGITMKCGKTAKCIIDSSNIPYTYLVMYYYVAIVKQLEDAMRNYKAETV